MPDLHDDLQRLADFVGEAGSFVDLDALRQQRERRRRASALTVTFAVLVIVGIGAYAALRPSVTAAPFVTPAATGTAVAPRAGATIWPENAVNGDQPRQVQASADAGDQDVQWRIEPARVVDRFVHDIFGGRQIVNVGFDEASADGSVLASVRLCREATSGTCSLPGDSLSIVLVQPETQGEGGIWSVGSATSSGLDVTLNEGPDGTVSEGSDVVFDVSNLSGATAHLDVVASNGCNVVHAGEEATHEGQSTLRIPNVYQAGPTCAATPGGYAFVYVSDGARADTTDPLEEPTSIAYPMTIVPFTMDANTLVIVTPTPDPSSPAAP